MKTAKRKDEAVIAFVPPGQAPDDEKLELFGQVMVFSLEGLLDLLGQKYLDWLADPEEVLEAELRFLTALRWQARRNIKGLFGLQSRGNCLWQRTFVFDNIAEEPEKDLAVSPQQIQAAAAQILHDLSQILGWRYEGPPERQKFFEYRLRTPPTENCHALSAFVRARRLSNGDLDQKLVHYYEAARLDPCFGEAHYTIAYILRQQKRPLAIRYYRLAIQTLIDSQLLSEAHAELGLCLAEAERFPEAIREFHAAFRLNSRNEEACLNLGIAYDERGNLKLAERYFRKAQEINPNSYWACRGLAQIYIKKKEWDKAIAEAKRLIVITPANPEGHYLLGCCYAQNKNFAQANKHLKLAAKLDPKGEIAKKAFRVLAQLGK